MYFDETAWVAIAFVLFIGLIWRKASESISSILNDKSLVIKNDLDEAKILKEEALEELRKSMQLKKIISDESEKIIEESKNSAKQILEDAKVKSSEIIKRIEYKADQKILSMETESINNIKTVTGKIIINASKLFIISKLDKKENADLILKASKEIKKSVLN